LCTPLRRSQNPISEFFELAPIFFSRLTPLNQLQSSKPFCNLTYNRFSAFIDTAIAQSKKEAMKKRSRRDPPKAVRNSS
ncbi:MAG: hypothetical protein QNJ70_28620, partial [Xenococcaceae cyanobacterium MO_207.B15]|nr:hypothetical protein [Xenococcaceae cyanobacterium MO_207.B15]